MTNWREIFESEFGVAPPLDINNFDCLMENFILNFGSINNSQLFPVQIIDVLQEKCNDVPTEHITTLLGFLSSNSLILNENYLFIDEDSEREELIDKKIIINMLFLEEIGEKVENPVSGKMIECPSDSIFLYYNITSGISRLKGFLKR